MADWLQPTFTLFPFAAWMFLGVGIPWALALLPRSLWTERVTVIAVGMALGPLGLTSVMFILGTLGKLTLGWTMIGSAILAVIGVTITMERRLVDASDLPVRIRPRPSWMGWVMMVAIVLLVVTNIIVTAYWPFVAYDPQWVYAYNAKIFVLEGEIPSEIGYYPQLVPLSYTYMQQAWGGINDHAARVVIPWFNVTMILMAYTLGRRVFGSRRVGLLTAAIWTFYPHVAAWSGAGDLEIPVTIYVTGASAFFIDAWRTERSRSAILSGVMFSGALWTKPTGGAWALGVMLALIGWSWLMLFRLPSFGPRHRIALILTRGILSRFWIPLVWSKLRLALITALACAPLGGMWYLRNLAYNHAAVDFPASYWNSFAQRSGQEMGWPILIAALTAGWLLVRPPERLRKRTPFVRIGWPVLAVLALIVAALPSALNWQHTSWDEVWMWTRGDLSAVRKMSRDEILLFAVGLIMLTWPMRGAWRTWVNQRRESMLLLWALLLPYGLVWLFYYSYHYRLSFPIVPLLAVQVAALIDWWVLPWMRTRRIGQVIGVSLMIVLVFVALKAETQFTYRHLLDNDLPDDTAKYDISNPALMTVVHHLEAYAAEHGEPVVSAPGEDRLPFFFPTWDVRVERDQLPTRLEDLDGVDIFISGSVLEFLWRDQNLLPNSLQADANVGAAYNFLDVRGDNSEPWPHVLQPIPLDPTGALPADDGTFRYMMYAVHPEARSARVTLPLTDEILIGDFAQVGGYYLGNTILYRGQRVYLTLLWIPTDEAPPARDYSVYIHLIDQYGEKIAQWDGVPLQNSYPTRFWRPDEYLMDTWILTIPEDLPIGRATLHIGLYDPISQERLRVTINGAPAGDGVEIPFPVLVQ